MPGGVAWIGFAGTLAASLLAAWATGTVLAGQRLPLRTLTTADGLPRDQVECVRTDGRGFVWFCTPEGLARWDGHVAVTFGERDGLNPSAVRSFSRTRSGRYWVGTDAGLFEFAATAPAGATRFHQVPRLDDQRTGSVYAITESRDGSLWCGTGHGLVRLTNDGEGGRLEEVEIGMPRESDNDIIVRAVIEDEQGTLWVGTGSGLYARRTDGTTERIALRDGMPDNQVWSVAAGGAGTIWVGTRSGLVKVDSAALSRRGKPTVQRVYTTSEGLPSANIRSLEVNGDGLWVGTVAGVAEVRLNAQAGLTVGRTLDGFYAWDMREDARGDLWIGSEAGALKLSRRGFTTYADDDGISARGVASIFVTPDRDVCATIVGDVIAVSCFDGRRFHPTPIPSLSRIRDAGWGWGQLVWQDRRRRWWVPTGEGLAQFPAGRVSSLANATPDATYDVRRGLRSNSVFRILEDFDGHIWVATWAEDRNGIARIDPESRRVRSFTLADGVPEDLSTIYAFAQSSAGTVWMGLEERRLLRYRDGRFSEVRLKGPDDSPSGGGPAERIWSLLVDSRQRLWIASSASGVGRIDDPEEGPHRIRWYGVREGLSSNTAWVVIEGPSGDIVVGTGRGVDQLDPDTGRIVHYSAEHGVPRGEIRGATRDPAGQIWLATTAGVSVGTALHTADATPPVTVITGVRVGGLSLPIPADGTVHLPGIEIEPGARTVEVDFVSPGGRQAEGLKYQHQLTGLQSDWVTTDARTVTLAALAPGRYRLQIRALLANDVIGSPAWIELRVLSPVWRRSWFLALVALGLASLAWLLHRARVKRLLAIQRVRSQIAADLHDGVGARLSRIAILSEVVRHHAQTALPGALPTLTAIGENARDVIDDMGDAVWFVDSRADTLGQLLIRVRALASELFDDRGLRWMMNAPPAAAQTALSPELRRHLYLMLKEGLTNVARHAGATQVTLDVTTANGRLRAELTDNGKGLKPDARQAAGAGGRGLESLRTRAAALGGSLEIRSGGGQSGVTIAIEVPLGSPRRRRS
jgi:signal transduction histidine kinase/ligand-binding sensor domain-containing protein